MWVCILELICLWAVSCLSPHFLSFQEFEFCALFNLVCPLHCSLLAALSWVWSSFSPAPNNLAFLSRPVSLCGWLPSMCYWDRLGFASCSVRSMRYLGVCVGGEGYSGPRVRSPMSVVLCCRHWNFWPRGCSNRDFVTYQVQTWGVCDLCPVFQSDSCPERRSSIWMNRRDSSIQLPVTWLLDHWLPVVCFPQTLP